MKKIDQYIKKHQQAFDEEPAAGHFERFQQKMNAQKSKSISFHRWTVIAAASLLLLLSLGVALQQRFTRQAGLITLCENSADMKQCYMAKMNDAAFQIEALTKKFDLNEWEREFVMDEVQEILQSISNFEEELPEELPEELTNSILSDYYQRNLESLNTIVQNLLSY